MKYAKILFNKHVIYIISALIVLGFLALSIYNRVEGEIEGTKHFRDTHRIILPAE